MPGSDLHLSLVVGAACSGGVVWLCWLFAFAVFALNEIDSPSLEIPPENMKPSEELKRSSIILQVLETLNIFDRLSSVPNKLQPAGKLSTIL